MKLLLIFIILISFNAYADDECVFDESAYVEFVNKYALENKNSKIENGGKTLVVDRGNDQIVIIGGGCVHLGVSIDLKSNKTYTEEQFLKEILKLSKEFGSWLIDINALESSINKRKFQVIEGVYYVEVNVMTVFSASYNTKSEVNIEFYIN